MNHATNKWWKKFPSTLKSPYGFCFMLICLLDSILKCTKIISRVDDSKKREELLMVYLLLINSVQIVLPNFENCLFFVYDELAGVNNEIIKWQFSRTSQSKIYLTSSWHELIYEISRDWLFLTYKEIYSIYDPNFVVDFESIYKYKLDKISREEIVKYITPKVLKINNLFFHFDKLAESRIFKQWMIKLTQEISRAYDRRLVSGRTYPEDDIPADPRIENNFLAVIENENQKRPAYIRDHTWLSWSLKEGSTPAKIRDRWNQLSDTERRKKCPTAYNKIGGGNSGREVVKKALERAKTELIPKINL